MEDIIEEIFWEIRDETDREIDDIKENWVDNISCPQNITMSWTSNKTTSIASNLIYSSWTYNSKWINIYFNADLDGFSWAVLWFFCY